MDVHRSATFEKKSEYSRTPAIVPLLFWSADRRREHFSNPENKFWVDKRKLELARARAKAEQEQMAANTDGVSANLRTFCLLFLAVKTLWNLQNHQKKAGRKIVDIIYLSDPACGGKRQHAISVNQDLVFEKSVFLRVFRITDH